MSVRHIIEITENGTAAKPINYLKDMIKEVMTSTAELYMSVGYMPPRIGYLAIEENKCAGTVHSSHPQRTTAWKLCISLFSEFEGRGVATRTAQALVQIAFEAVPEMTIAAQPFPEENTSNNVPSKLGFQFFAELEHPTEVRLALREIFISSRFFGPSLYNRRIFFLFSENKTRSR